MRVKPFVYTNKNGPLARAVLVSISVQQP